MAGSDTARGADREDGTTPPATSVRASAERAIAIGGNARTVVSGDGVTIVEKQFVQPTPSPAAAPSEEEIATAVAAYAGQLAHLYGRLDLEVLTPLPDDHPAVELRDVFVTPTVRAELPPVELPRELLRRLAEAGELPDRGALPPGVDDTSFAALRESYLRRPEQDVLDVLAAPANRLLVVLGDPGAGKSTLVRHLSLTLAFGAAPDQPPALAGRVPLVIELRRYAEEQWRHSGFEDFLTHLHDDYAQSVPRPVLEELLASGRALVVFDGLDELFDPKVRARTAERIAAFAVRRPSARIVVTSRVIGYQRALLEGAGFTHFMLQDLDEERIGAFVRSWYRVSCPGDPLQAGRLVERLTSAVQDSRPLREMAGNPLLLTVLAIIGRRQTLPHNRRSVYEHAVTVLVSHWDQAAKLIKAPLPAPVAEALDVLGPDERVELLRLLARAMQEGHSGIAGNHIHGPDLERVFRDYLQQYELPPVHATAAARAMVAQLHERNFILSRYGGDVYGFVHRAFLEHLAAADIAHRYKEDRAWTPEELVEQVIAGRAQDPAWHEVLLLLAGQIGTATVGAAVDRLLALHEATPDQDASHVALALRMLAETGKLRELSAQSAAVVDAATRALDARGRKGPWLLDEAVPALGSFSPHWTGHRRLVDWFRISGQFSPSEEPTDTVCALRLGRDDLAALARRSYYGIDRLRFLYTWAQRSPDDTEVRDLLQHMAEHEPQQHLRSTALDVLADVWPDSEEVRSFVTARAQQDPDGRARCEALASLVRRHPDDPALLRLATRASIEEQEESSRALLLRALGRWSGEHEKIRRVVMARAAEDPHGHVRRDALRVLGEYAGGHAEVRALLGARAVDAADGEERETAMWALAEHCSGDERVRELLLERSGDGDRPADSVRALQLLSARWPGDADVHRAIVRATSHPDAGIRRAGVDMIRAHRSWQEDLQDIVLRLAAEDPDVGVRWAAIRLIGRDRFEHDGGRDVLMTVSRNSDRRVRDDAVYQLAQEWPDHPEVRDLLLKTAGDVSALTLSVVLEGLIAHWSDRNDVHDLLVGIPDLAKGLEQALLLDLLMDHWPDWDDLRAAVVRRASTCEYDGSGRVYALRTLAKRWFDRDDVRAVVVDAVRDPSDPYASKVVLGELRRHWSHRDDVRAILVGAARQHERPDVRVNAIRTLGLHWAHHPDAQALFLHLASDDPDADVRFHALRRWALVGGGEACGVVAGRAGVDPDAVVRRKVLHMLALAWPERTETIAALRDRAERDGDEETREAAVRLLADLAG
ncbi:HEAT repeat domain-containing protein [Streptomyces sp. enrichment culture]|uniref:HEAT repeat domain-containing protein n=1 Tax=Streptomyces sp. enrichment culture TaxID=1795815 RepID=UPI003F544703